MFWFFDCFSFFPSIVGSSSGSPNSTPGVSDTCGSGYISSFFICCSCFAVHLLKRRWKRFCKLRAGSVLPLTIWKNSTENKTVHLKNMYAAFTMILPLLLWKYFASLLHSIWVIFKLFFSRRQGGSSLCHQPEVGLFLVAEYCTWKFLWTYMCVAKYAAFCSTETGFLNCIESVSYRKKS